KVASASSITYTVAAILKLRIPDEHVEGVKIPHQDAGVCGIKCGAQHRGFGATVTEIAASQSDVGVLENVVGVFVPGIKKVASAIGFRLVYGDARSALAVEGQPVKARISYAIEVQHRAAAATGPQDRRRGGVLADDVDMDLTGEAQCLCDAIRASREVD